MRENKAAGELPSGAFTMKERKTGKGMKMEEKKNILTYEGLRRYEDELHDLKVVKRQEVAQKIKEAREQGDLSENAEYDAAKDEQRDIEARIEELEKILKNAEVVVEDEVDLEKINIGCRVRSWIWNIMKNWSTRLWVPPRPTA